MITIDSVSPDAETVVNDNGGLQSKYEFDLTLVPPLVLLDVAKVLNEGKNKYGLYNHRKISINDHMNHALIHIFAHLSNDRQEGEIGHLTHALCRLFFVAEMTQIENGISVKPDFDQ